MKTLTLIALVAIATVSCVGNRNSSSDPYMESLDEFHNQIALAVRQDDSIRFASMCRYPIEREYPLHDIEDSAMMVRHFNIIFDDPIKKVLEKATSDDWGHFGWRGTTLHNGEYIWCDERCIYSINYRSEKEITDLDSLRKADMASLPDDLSDGWIPETCLKDSMEIVYRIDKNVTNEQFRLMTFDSDRQLYKVTPGKILYGELGIEGSAATHVYTFIDNPNNNLVIMYFPYEYIYVLTDDDPMTPCIYLKKVYWLDYINRLAMLSRPTIFLGEIWFPCLDVKPLLCI